MVAQTSYAVNQGASYPGLIANLQNAEKLTKTAFSNIAFGAPVFERISGTVAAADQCPIGSLRSDISATAVDASALVVTEYRLVGVAVRSLDTENTRASGATVAAQYVRGDAVAVMRTGEIYVQFPAGITSGNVNAAVYVTDAGVLSLTSTANTALNATLEEAITGASQIRVIRVHSAPATEAA